MQNLNINYWLFCFSAERLKKYYNVLYSMSPFKCGCVFMKYSDFFPLMGFYGPLFSGNQIAALSQMSWLMKTAAIELRVTSLNRQRSHTQHLVSLLLDDQPHAQHTGMSSSHFEGHI